LVALDEYFRVYEKDEPNYIARLWFGENFVSEQKWEGLIFFIIVLFNNISFIIHFKRTKNKR
jgi:hypothetical protein